MSRSSEQIQLFIGTVCDWASGCYELRCFDADIDRRFNQIVPSNGYRKVMGGWYGRIDAAACEVERVQHVSVYLCPNPADSAFLSRRANKVGQIKKGEGVRDEHITRIDWLSIDIDPAKRLSGVSATADELAAALALRDHILASEPALAAAALSLCTGNGGGILLRLPGLPNDEPTRALLKDVLRGLAARYSNADAKIDTNTYPPSRGIGIPGTQKCKGENTADRPWRYVAMESCGRLVVPIDPAKPLDSYNQRYEVPACEMELLQALQGLRPRTPEERRTPEGKGAGAANGADGGTGKKAGKARSTRRGAAGEDEQTFRLRRAEAYLQSMQPANGWGGQGGHNKTFEAACALVKGFGLSVGDATPIFRAWNQSHCDPPWDECDLEHKLEDADKKPDDKPRGYLFEQDLKDFRKEKGHGGGKGGGGGNNNGRPNDGAADDDGREIVEVGPEEDVVVIEAMQYLAQDDNVFFRNNMLVRILKDDVDVDKEIINRNPGSPVIDQLPGAMIRRILSRYCRFGKFRSNGDFSEQHPPKFVVDGILADGEWKEFRRLDAIIESAILRPDGTIFNQPGYDASMMVLLQPNGRIPMVPDVPTKEDLDEAVALLQYLVVNFPFPEPVDRAAWLAALLTPFARHAYAGPSPFFLIEANTPGTGKSLLCDLISIIYSGRPMARTTYSANDEESRKRITAIAMAGDMTCLLDNIDIPLGGAAFEALLTATTWKDRVLGVSKMTQDLVLKTVWYGTGNNVAIRGDIRRRIVLCRIQTSEEHPEIRTEFKEPDIEKYAIKNRDKLAAAALTILRAYVVAGSPKVVTSPFGSYNGWSDLVRSAVLWATDCDPVDSQSRLREADQDTQAFEAFIVGWLEVCHANGKTGKGMTVHEVLGCLTGNPHGYETLREVLLGWSSNDNLPGVRSISNRIRRHKDRNFKGLKLIALPTGIGNIVRWQVVDQTGEAPTDPAKVISDIERGITFSRPGNSDPPF